MGHPSPELLVFEVGGRRFGLPALEVRELVRVVTIVPLPQAPPIVEGAINLRGRVIPVLDLRAQLRLPAKAAEPSDHLIVTRARGRMVAVRIDRALELMRPDATEAGWAEDGMTDDAELAGVAKFPDGLVPILNLSAFLTQAESDALGAALPRAEATPGEERRS